MVRKMKWGIVVLFCTLFLLVSTSAFAVSNASLIHLNSTPFDDIYFGAESTNTTNPYLFVGGRSYHDFDLRNDDAYLHVCDDNLSTNQKVDLRYYSESYNITQTVLYYQPLVVSVDNTSTGVGNETTFCTTLNVRLASTLALYPGLISVYVNDTLFLPSLNMSLNGSFNIGVTVKSTPKRYLFNTAEIYGQNESILIDSSADYLLTTLVSANDTLLVEDKLEPYEHLTYEGELRGGEKIYVNGLLSLEIKIFNPCDIINESGYYILNNTNQSLIRNVTGTCVTIQNLTNVVLNFGDDYISGDNLTNGSLAEGICPVLVENSANITFEHFQTQEFYYGICVRNSSVNLFGDGATYNTIGAFVTDNSVVEFEDLGFANSDAEVQAFNDSFITFRNVTIATAALNSEVYNVVIKSVVDEPPLPAPAANGTDIDQFVEVNPTQSGSWAQLNFIYPEPLPNGLAIDDVRILKYNGTYEVQNVTTITLLNGTNVSETNETLGWYDGNWSQLFTLVSPSTSEIIAPNQTNFSVFAPFAYEINNTLPDPVPEPEPDPDPDPDPSTGSEGGSSSGGGGGGSGGSPLNANDEISVLLEAIRLNITFDEDIVLEQGEPRPLSFTLNNTGDVDASDITIVARVPTDWETVNVSIAELLAGEGLLDTLLIAPHEKAVPKTYLIPIDVYVKNGSFKVTTELVEINVIPARDLRRLRVVEYPPVIEMSPNEQLNISFLVKNVGSNDLNDVKIQFSENTCLRNVNGANSIVVGETTLFKYNLFSNQPGVCDIEITFYEDKTLVGFVPLTLVVKTQIGLQTKETNYILLILLFVWTIITFVIIGRKRDKKEAPSGEVKHEL